MPPSTSHSNEIPCIQGHSAKSYKHPPHEHRVQDGDADTLRYRDSDGIQQPHQSYITMSVSESLCASRWQLPQPRNINSPTPRHSVHYEVPHRFTHINKHRNAISTQPSWRLCACTMTSSHLRPRLSHHHCPYARRRACFPRPRCSRTTSIASPATTPHHALRAPLHRASISLCGQPPQS